MSQVDELLLLLALYQKKYGILADSAVELIKKYLAEGYSPEKAIQMALKGSNFFAVNEGYIVDTAVTAAVLGYGLTDKAKVSTMRLRSAMLNEVWASDKLNLSKRLHGSRKDMRQTIVDAISSAMKQGKTWVQMARDLYDGYSYGHITKKTVLPEYLANLVRQSKKILTGDSSALGEYKTAIKNAERQIGRLANDGTPTKAMKQAFKDLVDATASLNEEAIDKAIKVAVEEKSRYIADRIARTEMSQAWGDGFFAKYHDDPDVIAYRWRLSSRHPVYDICDIHASVDCYGLGEGIYPKDKFPKRPAHPHCMCLVTPVYVGNLEMDRQKENNLLSHAKFNPDAVSKYISGLSRQRQVALLGVDGLKTWKANGSWQHSLRGWDGDNKPKTRVRPEDFEKQPTRIPDGDYNLKIRPQVQKRHIEGTKEYQKYEAQLSEQNLKPGIMTYANLQGLVNKYSGKGEIQIKKDGSKLETVVTDTIIGKYWNYQRQEYLDTKAFKIVYSKKGTHVYPVWDGTKEGF